ncbi:2-oxoisovalerate dehydrogenase subunit alpha, mitochondrial-like [Patella vulgata]|uniref:2-oxoisovalerate dehydrogenase subunit alpha, mitochondrial-like n=1 Tax=Patella vulgata TaxID=6465 RepID=UPI00218030AA|nr:2-oxoisovalerate dehydrogenase subunit alpha, mitochondrial-like [Patella vulgata]
MSVFPKLLAPILRGRLRIRGVLCLWQSNYKRLKSTNIQNVSQYIKKGINGESLENTHQRNSHTKEKYEFLGSDMEYCDELDFIVPEEKCLIPVYRVLNRRGEVVMKNQDPKLSPEMYLKMYKDMVLIHSIDTVLTKAQTSGVVSFYLTNHGEEATQIGSAAALDAEDLIYAQYREAGVLLWRGFAVENFVNQCLCNNRDLNKGRQMPVHYGSKDLNFVTISSNLGTQLPQAAGSAYVYKLAKRGNCVICYFGEGTASEGDAHPAFNFAAVLNCPVIFFCRNNGYAISTSLKEQYSGDGVAARGAGYGMISIRIDGNDVLAVYNAVKAAREICLSQNRPVLIEAMTYRVGNHTTLVDGQSYRTEEEVEDWKVNHSPIERFSKYITNLGLWDDKRDLEWKTESIDMVKRILEASQEHKLPSPEAMFTDVYDVVPKHLEKQFNDMKRHLQTYPDVYPLEKHDI